MRVVIFLLLTVEFFASRVYNIQHVYITRTTRLDMYSIYSCKAHHFVAVELSPSPSLQSRLVRINPRRVGIRRGRAAAQRSARERETDRNGQVRTGLSLSLSLSLA